MIKALVKSCIALILHLILSRCSLVEHNKDHSLFLNATAGSRRQLEIEVEFFNVCKLLHILLQSNKNTEDVCSILSRYNTIFQECEMSSTSCNQFQVQKPKKIR